MTFPPNQGQPGYGYQPQPQQGYGQQQPQAAPPLATQSVDDFFADSAGSGAPSFRFKNVGDTVVGTIVDMKAQQRTDFSTGAPKVNKDGRPQMQLIVTLQTQLRGWQQVKKIPTTADASGNKVPLGPENDDGKRRIYVWYTLREALESALQAVGKKAPSVGDELAVQVTGSRANAGGNDSHEFRVAVKPGSPAAEAFFDQQGGAQQAQQAPPPAQAPQQFQQPAPQAAPPQQYAPAPQQGFPPAQPPQQFQQPAAPPQQFAQAPQPNNEPPF